MPCTVLHAEEARHLYRFGSWTVVMPPSLDAATLTGSGSALQMPDKGLEILAYWQDGKQRALALRFDATDLKKDVVALRSFKRVNPLKGCKLGGGSSSIKPLKTYLPKSDAPPELEPLPDDTAVTFSGIDRSLRRTGDLLVVDLGTARIQLADDSPIVRLGEWGSAEFCRFELKPLEAESDADDEATQF